MTLLLPGPLPRFGPGTTHALVASEVDGPSPASRGRRALVSDGNTGHTSGMKSAVSLPDDLFREIDACARALKLTRSGLLATAAREFLARHRRPSDATDAWNRAIARAGQPGDDPAAVAFRRRTKAVVRVTGKPRS